MLDDISSVSQTKMLCIVHYQGYCDEYDSLLSVTNDIHARLITAKGCRMQLGGGHMHEVQCSRIPELFTDGLLYHTKCYKKFTGAISIANKNQEDKSHNNQCIRTRRTGEMGTIILPKYCMYCKKEPILMHVT